MRVNGHWLHFTSTQLGRKKNFHRGKNSQIVTDSREESFPSVRHIRCSSQNSNYLLSSEIVWKWFLNYRQAVSAFEARKRFQLIFVTSNSNKSIWWSLFRSARCLCTQQYRRCDGEKIFSGSFSIISWKSVLMDFSCSNHKFEIFFLHLVLW